MFSALSKEHATRQNAIRTRIERYRRDAQAAIDLLNGPLLDSLNLGVAQVFKNERDLEADAKRFQAAAAAYHKQCRDWLSLVDQFDNALKELGDVRNWAAVMERDMLQIVTAVERTRDPAPLASGKDPSLVPTEEDRDAVEAWLNDE
ncbi:biogenesis of lysosome-related organelles complex 1 subunit 1 [Hyaloraphidium curvatum]|nr:biogenesis of lysosome-related organelles complex 1 subunit 1 [Hyaloraphidium curvatum]